jgi:hypothetical protein
MSRLFVFGDSYSTPYVCVDPVYSFWGLCAKHLAVDEIINVSRPVNSFDSVCQLLVGIQNEYQYNWTEDWFIIGIPPLERITIFDDHKDTAYKAKIISVETWKEVDTTIQAHRGLISQQFYGGDQFLTVHADRSWTETQTLRQIYLLTQWLDTNRAKYLICNLSKPLDRDNRWGPSEFVLNYTINHDRCIVFDDTYYSVNVGINLPPDADNPDGWNGHHGPAGNKHYFEKSLKHKLDNIVNNT